MLFDLMLQAHWTSRANNCKGWQSIGLAKNFHEARQHWAITRAFQYSKEECQTLQQFVSKIDFSGVAEFAEKHVLEWQKVTCVFTFVIM